jgi:hypothetical protein
MPSYARQALMQSICTDNPPTLEFIEEPERPVAAKPFGLRKAAHCSILGE